MKKTLFNLFLIIIAVFSATSVKAQVFGSNERYSESQMHLSLGAEGMYNVNPGKNFYGAGYGATGRFQYDVTQNLGLTFTTGFYTVKADNGNLRAGADLRPDFKYVPVKFGAKAYFLPEFFLGGEVGVGYANPGIVENSETHFSKILAPSIGYESNHLEASFRYENINHHNYYRSVVAIRIAYIFNF